MRDDFEKFKTAVPHAIYEDFKYHWFIVNTRSFYFVPAGAEPEPNVDDNMALCPFADLFNHTDEEGVSLWHVLYWISFSD